ncbi:MAG: hypothetical protein QOE84_3576, partial [Actinomycetota bacterium]|nr:hypothetical protein [Actinomycetota bacterium]
MARRGGTAQRGVRDPCATELP